ncbi:GntR family transcriptional regulator [Levilactobacillus brevis]|uniref:GntR family transcriptional regulator n=1 Tax=Levilactobacillus brevis TaxID=1580 RepID=UPI0021A46966|nr:GntR family transcriptional regulator [Levilactobacillus brevis]MCT2886257.1 GntR family transcriptional regulator [Levilactobacillus brevis]MCT3587152.1 GntR family transcriptional regulator [Levilactobacillus brevis]
MQLTNNMRSEAYNEIRYRIMHNKYTPGQKVSEKVISDELGIGRTPVREAIIRIERDGLIDVIPQSGTYISKIDMNTANNARFVRQIMEGEIMLEATGRMTDAFYQELQANMVEQERVVQKRDPDAFFDADEAFHKLFYMAADREEIWNWLQTINTQLNRFRWIRLKVSDLNWATLLNQHRDILKAVHDRNLDDVRFEITAHLRLMLSERKYLLSRFPDYFMNVSDEDLAGIQA